MTDSIYWPGTRIVKSRGNGFDWNTGEPSIFRVRAFQPNVNGESHSQTATRAVQEHEQRTGRSRGTISGLSVKADQLLGDETYISRARRAKAGAA